MAKKNKQRRAKANRAFRRAPLQGMDSHMGEIFNDYSAIVCP